jgi:hypothetical protein
VRSPLLIQNTFWKEEANEKGAQNERVICVWGLLHMQTPFGLTFETTALRVDCDFGRLDPSK